MTEDQIKAYIDDLARVSAKHRLYLCTDRRFDGCMHIVPIGEDSSFEFAGYISTLRGSVHAADARELGSRSDMEDRGVTLASVESIDVSEISAHGRLQTYRLLDLLRSWEPLDDADAFELSRGAVSGDVDRGE